jgi:hypothetical protein
VKFTVSDGKPLKHSGIVIRVDGKVVGRATTLGLDEDETIPPKLLKRVYGEIEADGLRNDVTADWGAVIENSLGLGKENVPRSRRMEFAFLKRANLKTGRAWAMKELLRELWHCKDKTAAERLHRKWHGWVMRSQLPPMKQVARMVKSHLPNILTYYAHRVTNAVSEGINSAIQTIKKRAFGFRNPDNFKTAIYFHCGGLELYPALS